MKVDPARIISRVKRVNGWHIALSLLLLSLLLFLSVRASDEYRWSDWGFGDAQVMLSLRQWEDGGWFSNYLLLIPQGYAKVVRMLDDPPLRHHAHGTCAGSSPRVGPRLWYTHYPPGFMIPYAVLFRVGLDDIFYIRLLSILFSLGALALMYVLFSKLTSPGISFVAVFFYAMSSGFLGYADTISNQPIDDLLRFAFMLSAVMATRSGTTLQQKRWMVAAWVVEFILSLSSFDSVFFVYAWLIGWDFLEKKGFRWKLYLVYALAPVSAHFLQFLQNAWYLGWNSTIMDIKDTFLLKFGESTDYNSGQSRLMLIVSAVSEMFGDIFKPHYLLAVIPAFYLFYRFFLMKEDRKEMPSILLLALLFVCGLAYVVILPNGARMPYQTRQMLPFASVLISGFTWTFIKGFLHGVSENAGPIRRDRILVPYLLLSSMMILSFWYSYLLTEHKPTYFMPKGDSLEAFEETGAHRGFGNVLEREASAGNFTPGSMLKMDVLFAKKLKELKTKNEPVYFDLGGFNIFWDPRYVRGYPQIMPITEYYAGSRPLLCFDAPKGLADDLVYMLRKSPNRFSPVLIASAPDNLQRTIEMLGSQGVLKGTPPVPYSVMGKYVLDLTDYLKWGMDEAH